YSITNINGVLINTGIISGPEKKSIYVADWPKGIYVLSITTALDKTGMIEKFIVN
ncbi:MAG: hypothetical protein DRJ05_13655, partial [Bacteroidetes bacterium]